MTGGEAMIIVQSPLRVSFFGGGTDLPSYYLHEGGCVLSSAINKYIFVSAKTRFDDRVRVGYTRTELVDRIDDLQHDLIREALRMTGVTHGVEITTMGDIPSAGSGLGSSSTVTVGTLQALHAFLGEPVTAERLAREACQIEIDVLGKPIGIQDQIIAAYGGMRFMEFRKDGSVSLERLELSADANRELRSNLMLFYTGIERRAETILSEQQMNIQQRIEVLNEMKNLAQLARNELKAGNVDELGHMLHYGWTLKKRLASGISNGVIDELYSRARKAGALGGKITGAGGGGFLLLYCPKERQASVRGALKKLRELPFRLEPDGVKTILNYPRSENGIDAKAEHIFASVTIDPNLRKELGKGLEMDTPHGNGEAINSLLRDYRENLAQSILALPIDQVHEAVRILHTKRMDRKRVFLFGNGGSSSTASHFACDLNKNTRVNAWPDFQAHCLSDNMPVFSAYANDEGYENVFWRQLQNELEEDDLVIGISASGNSENVLRGIRYANEQGAFTIGFTGFDGGSLGSLVDLHLHIPSHVIEQVEDIHLVLEHMIICSLKQITGSSIPDHATAHAEPLDFDRPVSMASTDTMEPDEVSAAFHEPRSRAEWIFQLQKALLENMPTDAVFEEVLQGVYRILDASSGSILKYDRSGTLVGGLTLFKGKLKSRTREEVHEIGQKGLAKWVYDHHEPALIANTLADARWIPGEGDSPPRSALSIPLNIQGENVGVLSVARLRENGFTESHLAFLTAINYLFSQHSEHRSSPGSDAIQHGDLPVVE